MVEERAQRRLAAILAADVVGYSRLMEADETGTFERLRAHRKELFEPEIAKHHGRVFKLMGDGLLAEFGSIVDAVECAVDLQRGMTERNSGIPQDRRIDLRIGVNLGDVIVEGEDRHGDGVNIAARLQQLAEPGGISVSRMVVDNVKHKLALRFESLGEHQVKNLTEPVHIYRVLLDPNEALKSPNRQRAAGRSWRWSLAAVATLVLVSAAGAVGWWRPWEPWSEPASVEHMALPLPEKPSIIVLPFVNMSSDADQEYFADGITEDLTTDLSRIAGLFVIARNTAFTYKGKDVRPSQVAEELGVRYILEGSVRRAGEEVRINAQLIDAISGGHVWADRYDGSLADIFSLQDKVTGSIVDALALRLTAAEQASLMQKETDEPAAYDAFLRGWEHYRRSTPEDYVAAIPNFEEAIRLDPEFGRAYAALALVYFSTYDRWWHESLGLSYAEAKEKARQYLADAEKRPTSTSHQVAGSILRAQGHYEQALAEFRTGIALDPSDSWNYAFLAETLNFSGRSAEAV
ncbi:MAG: adenylate/guanylate cyclase domain-containing protein, partial [Burkholderiales bacterium]